MNILLINGSPKKKGGASAFFSKVLGFMLFPQRVMSKTIGVSRNYENIFTYLKSMDTVILSVPLYVDGIPSHMIHFLQQMEWYCVHNKCKFMLYVISNSGFVEGRQNHAHLEQYKCWSERAGITWGGGLGIGGGVMLHVIFYVMLLLSIIQFIIGILINIFSGEPAR
jgi:multimeric flavodoxin WrbA